MINPLTALKWRICGSYDLQGPVTEDGPIRALNRAKYETWKYHTFGPGRNVFFKDKDFVYRVIDSGELQGEPLHVNDPNEIASLASIIAEMESHKFIAMITPVGSITKKEDIENQENEAIDKVVKYLVPNNLPPTEYTKWHTNPHETLGWMNYYAPKRYSVKRVITPDVPIIRETTRSHFKRMLEKLKQYNNPK